MATTKEEIAQKAEILSLWLAIVSLIAAIYSRQLRLGQSSGVVTSRSITRRR